LISRFVSAAVIGHYLGTLSSVNLMVAKKLDHSFGLYSCNNLRTQFGGCLTGSAGKVQSCESRSSLLSRQGARNCGGTGTGHWCAISHSAANA